MNVHVIMKTKTPNLKIIPDFLPNANDFFHLVMQKVQWDERMRARKTASFGVSYDYSGISYPKTSLPTFLEAICQKIDQTLGFYPNNCLLNYYVDGNASMGFHSDSSVELAEGTGVAIVSLGCERNIIYRLKTDRQHEITYPLQSGALLYMGKDVQEEWLHAIPKQLNAGERVSLTFRQLVE